MKVTKPIDPLEHTETQRKVTKVQIGGLSGKLSEINESELQGIFEPFGPIEYVDVQRDPQTGRCKGFAFIQYTDPENAKQAAKDMKDLKLAGQKLTVQLVTGNERADTVTTSAAGGDEFLHSQANKEVLTKQLLRTGTPQSNLSRPPVSALSTQFLTLTNMFKMEGTTPAFFEDLKK